MKWPILNGTSTYTRLTAGVTRWWAGRDNAILTEPLQAVKTAQKRADSHQSGARIVGRRFSWRAGHLGTFYREAFAAPKDELIYGQRTF